MTEPVPALDPVLRRAVYLTGPTASGKTATGVALAKLLDAEVIALDSMTLYRGMDIGTAKPTTEEQQGVPHHLLDRLEVWEQGSVADYRGWALEAASQIESRGRRVLFVGGTPLYLKALIRGLFEGPAADPALRAELEAKAQQEGGAALHAELATIDPKTATRLHPNDLRRVIRAIEVFRASGQPMSHWQTAHEHQARGLAVIALQRDRSELHERINRRVELMFEAGFPEELERLSASEPPIHPVPGQAVGYREGFDWLAGRQDLAETIQAIQTRTRQFAKRQDTWFRNLAEVRLWPVSGDQTPEHVATSLAGHLAQDPGF